MSDWNQQYPLQRSYTFDPQANQPQNPSPSDKYPDKSLKASHIIATSNVPSRTIQLNVTELQMKYVLMAAEIDRLIILNSSLAREANMWKNKYFDLEKVTPRMVNLLSTQLKLQEEESVYKKKCFELENNIVLLGTEISRLQDNLGSKDREISYWKDRYTALEASLDNRIRGAIELKLQDVAAGIAQERAQLEHQNNIYKSQVKDAEEKIKALAGEIERLGDFLDQKTRDEAQTLRNLQNEAQKNIILAREKENSDERAASLSKQLQDTQDKLALLTVENARLLSQLREREGLEDVLHTYSGKIEDLIKENARLSDKIAELSSIENQHKLAQAQLRENESNIGLLKKENASLAQRLSELSAAETQARLNLARIGDMENLVQSLRGENNELAQKLRDQARDYDQQIAQLNDELRKLRQAEFTIQSLANENENWKKRYNDAIQDRNARESQAAARETELLQQIAKLKEENNEYERTMRILQEKFQSFESKLQIFVNENERLKELLRDKEKIEYESQELRGKVFSLENEVNRLRDEKTRLLAEIERLQKELAQARQDFNKLKFDFEDFKRSARTEDEINTLKDTLAKAKQQFDNEVYNLNKRIRDLEQERAALAQKVIPLEDENRNKDNQIAALIKELNENKQKVDNIQREAQNRIADVEQQYKNRLERERAEQINKFLPEKQELERQNNELKKRIQDKDEALSYTQNQNNQLGQIVQQQDEEIASLKEKIAMLGMRVTTLTDEVDNYRNANNEIAALRKRVPELEEQIQKAQKVIQDYEIRQVMLFIEIERLYLINNEFLNDIAALDTKCGQLVEELQNAYQRSAEAENLEKIIKGLRDQIDSLEQRNKVLIAENSNLSDLSLQRLKEIDNLKAKYQQGYEDNLKKSQGELLKKSNADLRELQIKFEGEKNNWEQQTNQLKSIIEFNKVEIQKLKEINEQRKAENQELRNKLNHPSLNPTRVAQLEAELKLTQEQYEQAKKELEEMKRSRDILLQEYQKESNKNLESLNDIVRESIKSVAANRTLNDPTRNTYSGNQGDPYAFYH